MPAGKHKSRTLRRVFRKTPGARNVLHYVKRKPKAARCGGCNAILQGVPRDIPSKIARMSKTQMRPERIFGGNLCHACTRQKIIADARESPNAVGDLA